MPYYDYSYQTIFLDKKGIITTSTDELFSANNLNNKNILLNFPFVESIFQTLSSQRIGQVYEFNKVKTIHTFLPGIYDYIFVKLQQCKDCQDSLMWIIVDKTVPYSKLLVQQQIRQERIIGANL